jgi:hypothetical protein
MHPIQDPTIRTSQAAALWSRPHSDFIEPMQALADSSGDAPDDLGFRLIVLGIQSTCSKDADNAETAAKAIFETRGNTPRLYRNASLFPTKACLADEQV